MSTTTTTTFAYDKSQRLTTQYSTAEAHYYSYNQRNMTTQIQDVKTSNDANRYFTYNAVGERVFGIDGTSSPSYWAYNGGKMISENLAGTVARWRHNHLSGQRFSGSLLEAIVTDGELCFPALKDDGSVMVLTDVSNAFVNKYETISFGNVVGSSVGITGTPTSSRLLSFSSVFMNLTAASQQMNLAAFGRLYLAIQAMMTVLRASVPTWTGATCGTPRVASASYDFGLAVSTFANTVNCNGNCGMTQYKVGDVEIVRLEQVTGDKKQGMDNDEYKKKSGKTLNDLLLTNSEHAKSIAAELGKEGKFEDSQWGECRPLIECACAFKAQPDRTIKDSPKFTAKEHVGEAVETWITFTIPVEKKVYYGICKMFGEYA